MRDSSRPVISSEKSGVASKMRPGAALLPQLPTPIFGREDDLRGLNVLLSHEDVRLITLTGAPGIGKTRLSIALCQDWKRSTGHAAYFVQLESVSDASLLLPTIALSFDIQRRRDVPLVDRIAARLRDKQALLVLDNFERLLAGSVEVINLLLHIPDLKIIVTSRSALRVRGEHEWNVLPLRLPQLHDPAHLATLEANPSVALLLDRSSSGQSRLVITRENAAAIAAICVRLEGIPLAIELAAPWLRLFPPGAVLERLNSRLDLLHAGARDLPDRQRTLANAIGWSHNLLEPEEQRLFHQLSVFRGGWTLEAAEIVCEDERENGGTRPVLDCLSVLLERSLVYRVTPSDQSPRFAMLEMIREFAGERLVEDGETVAARERHAAYFQSFIHAAVPHLYREDQALWLERVEHEIGNVRSTLRWFIDQNAKLAALQLATGLENFWLVHDHLGEGQHWLEECLALSQGSYPSSEAKARRALAVLLMRRGEYDRAEHLQKRTLAFAHEVGDEELRAQTMLDLGSLHFIAGDRAKATAHLDRAVRVGERVRDQRTIARALNQLGEIDRLGGDDTSAALHYEQSLEIWRRLAERERVAMVLHNMAPVIARLRDRSRAVELFRESLTISRDLRNLHGLALCLVGITGIVDRGGTRAVVAAELLGSAEAFREAIGVQWQPVDRAECQRSIEHVGKYLDRDSFSAAFAEGARHDPSRAVDLALVLLDGETDTPVRPVSSSRIRHARGGLSRREFDIAHEVAQGFTNREIAERLHISDKTVEMHVSHSLRKLGLRSRVQLAAWMAGHGQPGGSGVTLAQSDPVSRPDTGENTGTSPIS